jgi:Putative adhesin
MKRPYSLVVIAIYLALAAPIWAQQQGDTFHWTGKLAANQLLQIKNITGAIDAAGENGDTIDVTAVKSGPDRDQVRVEVVQSGEGVSICAVYPGGSCTGDGGMHSSGDSHRDLKAKVDFTVKLPRNLRFNAATVNGRVQADNLGRPSKLATVNGSVDASSSSWVSASSVNGSVKVAMGSADWDGRLKLSSVNGSVTLELPGETNTDVRFSSVNGNLSTDFNIALQGNFEIGHGPRTLRGTIGNGGRELDVSTVNGSLNIRKGHGAM